MRSLVGVAGCDGEALIAAVDGDARHRLQHGDGLCIMTRRYRTVISLVQSLASSTVIARGITLIASGPSSVCGIDLAVDIAVKKWTRPDLRSH